jgi:toxin ParE1/3/4
VTRPPEVRYRDQARTDFDEIFWFIAAAGSPKAALDYVLRLEERCRRIGDAPQSGRLRNDLAPGLRTIPFERSALICYVTTDGAVWITNIFRRGRDVEAALLDPASPNDQT